MTAAVDLTSAENGSSQPIQSQSPTKDKDWTYIEFLDKALQLNLEEYDIPKRVTFLEAFIQTGFEHVAKTYKLSINQETVSLVCRSFDSILHFMEKDYTILIHPDANGTVIYERLFFGMFRLIVFREEEINYKIRSTLKQIFSNLQSEIQHHKQYSKMFLSLFQLCENITRFLQSKHDPSSFSLPDGLLITLADKGSALLIVTMILDTLFLSLTTSSTLSQIISPPSFNYIFNLTSQLCACLKARSQDVQEVDEELDQLNGLFADICSKALSLCENRSLWCDLIIEWLFSICQLSFHPGIGETLDIKASSLAIDIIGLIITNQSGTVSCHDNLSLESISSGDINSSNIYISMSALQKVFIQTKPSLICSMLHFQVTFLQQKVSTLRDTIQYNEIISKSNDSSDAFMQVFQDLSFMPKVRNFGNLEKVFLKQFNTLTVSNKIHLIKRMGLVACFLGGTLNVNTLKCTNCDFAQIQNNSCGKELNNDQTYCLGFQKIFKVIASSPDFVASIPLVYEFLQAFYRYGSVFNIVDKNGKIDYIEKWIFAALRSSSRDIRVAACQIVSLPSISYFCQLFVANLAQIDVFGKDSHLKETTIMAYAQLAKPAEDEDLNEILVHMIRFLAKKDAVDSSLLIYHTKAIVRHRSLENVEHLFSPFWESVCKELVQLDMVDGEGEGRYKVMREFCRIIDVPYFSQFFEITHPYIIPLFVLKGFTKGINDIADKVIKSNTRNKVGELLKEDISKIIATTLLESKDPMKYVIQNFLNTTNLKALIGGQNETDREAMIISKYRLDIAFELLKMYDFKNESNSHKIDQAFNYLQTQIHTRRNTSSLIDTTSNSFFQENTLAVFTRFSNDIRDVNSQISTFEKRKCLYGLIKLIKCAGYGFAKKALHQACVLLQAALETAQLQEITLYVWKTLLENMPDKELGTMTDLTFSVVIQRWPTFTEGARQQAHKMLSYLTKNRAQAMSDIHRKKAIPYMYGLEDYLPDIYSLIKAMDHRKPLVESQSMQLFRGDGKPKVVNHPLNYVTGVMVRASNDNVYIVRQTLLETLQILKDNKAFIAASRDRPRIFTVYVKNICFKLLDISNRFGDSETDIPFLCAECLGYLGALDPSEVDMPTEVSSIIVIDNFEDRSESVDFVTYFLEKYLVKAYLSSTDPNSQLFFAYGIQEFLKFCKLYQEDTLNARGKSNALWEKFPSEIQTAMAPMRTSRYTPTESHETSTTPYPIFKQDIDYMDWLNTFAMDILKNAKGNKNAEIIFKICRKTIRDPDPSIVNFILPYATLNVILSCEEDYCKNILNELLIVLNADQNENRNIKRFYSSVFSVLDYLNNWSQKRQFYKDKSSKTSSKSDTKNQRLVEKVGNFLNAISPDLMARKSYECKSYPRAIMYWEREMDSISETDTEKREDIYSKFMEIYVNIDDPDSLDGVARSFKTLSIPHKILTLETAGRWDNALECYESMAKSSSEWDWNTDTGYNMLRTMKVGGNYESLLNIIDTIHSSQGGISDRLLEIGIETSWIQPNFERMKKYLSMVPNNSSINCGFDVNVARALLALNDNSQEEFDSFVEKARSEVATSLASSKVSFLYQCQDHLAKLHGLFDLEYVGSLVFERANKESQDNEHPFVSQFLDGRLSLVGTNYATKCYLLALRRSAIMSTK